MVAHIALVIWVPGCAVAAWWQVGIALGGDGLGWVYSVMWPCFAIFGIVFWWFLIHDDPETLGARGMQRAEAEHGGDDERLAEAEAADPELAAYNAYLSALAAEEKSWRRR